jgi:hypothetical protein
VAQTRVLAAGAPATGRAAVQAAGVYWPVVLATLLLLVSVVLVQGGCDLVWFTVDGGNSGGPYTLNGTIGQSDAGVLSGGLYSLAGGFWSGAIVTSPPPPVWTETGGQAEKTILLPVWNQTATPFNSKGSG